MDPEQVWMQLDLRAKPICDLLEFALETGKSEEEDLSGEEEDDEDQEDKLQKLMEAMENGEEVDLEALREELDEEMDVEDESESESDESEDLGDDIGEDEEDIVRLRSSDEEHSDPEAKNTLFDLIKTSVRSKKKKGTSHGLNDDFFDLDAFNAETERVEAKSSSRGRLAEESEDSEDEDMSVDLFAPLEDEADEVKGGGGMSFSNTGLRHLVDILLDIFYRDFFAPPKNASLRSRSEAKAPSSGEGRVRFHDEVRVKKIKAKGKNLPLSLLHRIGGLDEDDEYGDDFGDEDEGSDDSGLDLDGDESVEDEETDEVMDEDDGLSSQSGDSEDHDNRATIERLKDDLFAEDDEASNSNGTLPFP